ncbi:MAG: sigma-70 family RNA polymerase sigma factor [Planctomycetaceae bacterium]|nr:sigma-70 family RNA polymerase sigma factor [Planctomycetaceae bacterium]
MTTATRSRSNASSDRKLRPNKKLRLSPEHIARLDQLLAGKIVAIESPEFFDTKQHATICAPLVVHKDARIVVAPAGTPPYLASLYDTPLLNRDEEFQLFRQMHFYKFLARESQDRLRSQNPQVADLGRLEQQLAAVAKVRNQIVQANLRLVVSIAKTMVDAGNTLDELISEGNVPLLRAVEIFDYTRGLRFSTYATWAVRHALFRLTPRNRLRRKRFMTGIEAGALDNRVAPMEAPMSDRQIAGTRAAIQSLLGDLDNRERVIVERRFGLGLTDRPYKFREIAGELRISTERVRQLLARALDRLRIVADKDGLDWDSAAG